MVVMSKSNASFDKNIWLKVTESCDGNLVQILERKMTGKAGTCVLPCTLREIWLQEYTSSSLDEQVIYYFYENDVSSC